jgi:two-component system chemotaxis response regulator CheV
MIDEQLSAFYEDDEDEIDIVKLVTSNANDANQYLVFKGLDNQYFGKNVSKIEEIVTFKDLSILKGYEKDFVIGTADVRGEMLTLVNFDTWMCGSPIFTETKQYQFVIIVSFGGYKFGLIVQDVDSITTIEQSNMQDSSSGNTKTTFVSKITVGKEEKLCTIVDSDKIILDVFGDKQDKIEMDLDFISPIETNKVAFFADDSVLVRRLIHKACLKQGVKHQIFENGKKLLYELFKTPKEDIGLIITDIEMPVMSGKEVLIHLRNDPKYDDVNILIFTNMSNKIMEDELLKSGATKVITKIDIKELTENIKEFIK